MILIDFRIAGLQLGICIAFHVIIGDLGPSLISKWTGLEVRRMNYDSSVLYLSVLHLNLFYYIVLL